MATHRLYHEKQEAGLCGVHCLNTLLQAPLFSEIDLAQIARKLDATERELMMEAGSDSKDFLKYMAEDSGNVADDGNYSVQVLSEALKVFGVEVLPLGKQQPPADITAYICNLAEHWFSLRRLHGHWWDFNSLLSGPRWISELALGLFLETLRQQGYSIFMIRGNLPAPNPQASNALSLGSRGRWLTVTTGGKEAQRNGDKDLEAALKASLNTAPPGATQATEELANNDFDDDPMLAAAIAASLASPSPPTPASSSAPKRTAAEVNIADDLTEDPELAAALALSRQEIAPPPASKPAAAPAAAPVPTSVVAPPQPRREPPAEPAVNVAGTLTVCIRMPDGSRFQRRYMSTDTLEGLHDAAAQKAGTDEFALVLPGPPKKDLSALPQTTALSEVGVGGALLVCQKRQL